MLFNILLLIVGFTFLVKGADLLIEGASNIAKKLHVSELIIGLTLVAFGTSLPELVVNIIASLKKTSDIALGNVIGSNITNILLILGLSCFFNKIEVQETTKKYEIPITLFSAIILLILLNDKFIDNSNLSSLSRIDGIVFLSYFVLFLIYIYITSKNSFIEAAHETHEINLFLAIVMSIVGLIILIFGGDWTVSAAVYIAKALGISEALIGLTIIAIGTSLPEMFTSIIAAIKNKSDIALGNIIGSNIFNTFLILGVSSTIRPLPHNYQLNLDIIVSIYATLLILLFSIFNKDKTMNKKNGVIFVLSYILYITYLIIRK